MLLLVPVAVVGSLLTAGVAALQMRRPPSRSHNLITALADPTDVDLPQASASLTNRQRAMRATTTAVTDMITDTLTKLNARYQQLFQKHIDPLFIDPTRREQLAMLAAGREQAVSEGEKVINRHIGIGVGAVATVGLAALTGLPLAPLVIATGFYLTIPLYRICWQIGVKERRLSVAHLLALYFTGMWLGGFYTVGAVGWNERHVRHVGEQLHDEHGGAAPVDDPQLFQYGVASRGFDLKMPRRWSG